LSSNKSISIDDRINMMGSTRTTNTIERRLARKEGKDMIKKNKKTKQADRNSRRQHQSESENDGRIILPQRVHIIVQIEGKEEDEKILQKKNVVSYDIEINIYSVDPRQQTHTVGRRKHRKILERKENTFRKKNQFNIQIPSTVRTSDNTDCSRSPLNRQYDTRVIDRHW
jgi:hypothetical protein